MNSRASSTSGESTANQAGGRRGRGPGTASGRCRARRCGRRRRASRQGRPRAPGPAGRRAPPAGRDRGSARASTAALSASGARRLQGHRLEVGGRLLAVERLEDRRIGRQRLGRHLHLGPGAGQRHRGALQQEGVLGGGEVARLRAPDDLEPAPGGRLGGDGRGGAQLGLEALGPLGEGRRRAEDQRDPGGRRRVATIACRGCRRPRSGVARGPPGERRSPRPRREGPPARGRRASARGRPPGGRRAGRRDAASGLPPRQGAMG